MERWFEIRVNGKINWLSDDIHEALDRKWYLAEQCPWGRVTITRDRYRRFRNRKTGGSWIAK